MIICLLIIVKYNVIGCKDGKEGESGMLWQVILKCRITIYYVPLTVNNLIHNTVLTANYYKHSAY